MIMQKRSGSIRVLLVEEDVFLAQIYKQKFEAEGWKVGIVQHGGDAYDEIKKKRPQVVLLDILLSQIDGFSILEKVKSDPSLKNIPVFILTNLGQKSDIEKGFALGATDYLIKAHFRPSETIEKIKKHLSE